MIGIGLVVAVIIGGDACATARFTIPTGAPVPRPDVSALWSEAGRVCRELEAFGGELRVGGRVGGQRIPGLRLGTAFDKDGRIAVEARVSATAIFSLRGTAESATLVLQQDRQVVTGRAEAVLDALVGLPVGPDRLMRVLAGCITAAPALAGETIGGFVHVKTADGDVYLAERDGRWHARGGSFGDLDVGYQPGDGAWPRQVRLSSRPGRRPEIDLVVDLVSVSTEPRPASVFVAVVPAGAERVTIEWLRDNGPLKRSDR